MRFLQDSQSHGSIYLLKCDISFYINEITRLTTLSAWMLRSLFRKGKGGAYVAQQSISNVIYLVTNSGESIEVVMLVTFMFPL
jgi:hypothetical protein